MNHCPVVQDSDAPMMTKPCTVGRRAVDAIGGERDEAVGTEERGGGDDSAQHHGRQAPRGPMHAGRQQSAQARRPNYHSDDRTTEHCESGA